MSGDLGYTFVTSIFRRECGSWKLLHRHADPITMLRPGESVIQA